MLCPSRLLLCDEATSSLDTHSEEIVQRALEQSFKGKTVLISAHRLHTLYSAQEVLVLEDGRLVQQGTFAALSAKADGPFAQMLQKGLIQ